MSKFAERVRAFNLGMSFQDEYAREISVFKSDVLHRLSSGEKLTPSQVEVLLTIEPILINQKLTEWIKAVISSKERQRGLLSDYRISEAYMRQRTWPDGQWRIYGEVLDMYALPESSILQDPAQVSEHSVAAIRKAFPVNLSDADPLEGADKDFEAQLRARGNPWTGYAGEAL